MNQEACCLFSKGTQIVSELGLNWLNTFYITQEKLKITYKKGGENKMGNLKRLFLASSIGMTFVVMCLLSVPVYAGTGYYYVTYGKSDWNWICRTYVDCYYETPSYNILYSSPYLSNAWYYAGGGPGISCTINAWQIEENVVNIMAYVRATYYPLLGNQWTSESQSWAYPSYTPQPTGGFYQEW